MKRLILKVKPATIILLLKDTQVNWYPSKIARDAKTSYVHTVNFLAELEGLGLVTAEKAGKRSYFKLTEKGAYIAQALDELAKRCDAFEAEFNQQKAKEIKDAKEEAQKAAALEEEKKGKPSSK